MFVHVFDIETSHPIYKKQGRLLSIAGKCVKLNEKTMEVESVLSSTHVNIYWNEIDWSHQPTLQFWQNNLLAYNEIRQSLLLPSCVAKIIYDDLMYCQNKAMKEKQDYFVLTDNAAFDISWINNFLNDYLFDFNQTLNSNLLTKTYNTNQIIDVSQIYNCLKNIKFKLSTKTLPKGLLKHNPKNDIDIILEKYLIYERFALKRRIKHT